MLIVLAIAKLFATSLLLATGWKGGYIFPIMFASVALGLGANLLFPGIPVAVAVAATMAGAMVASLKAPLFARSSRQSWYRRKPRPRWRSPSLPAPCCWGFWGCARRPAPQSRRSPTRRRSSLISSRGAAFDTLWHASCDNASFLLHMLAVIDVIGRRRKRLRRAGNGFVDEAIAHSLTTGHVYTVDPDQWSRLNLSRGIALRLPRTTAREDRPYLTRSSTRPSSVRTSSTYHCEA